MPEKGTVDGHEDALKRNTARMREGGGCRRQRRETRVMRTTCAAAARDKNDRLLSSPVIVELNSELPILIAVPHAFYGIPSHYH